MSGKRVQLIGCKSIQEPVAQMSGAQRDVEVLRGSIPVKHRPLHSSAAALLREGGDMKKKSQSCFFLPVLGKDKKILQILRWPGEKAGIGLEGDGVADRNIINPGKKGLETRMVTFAVVDKPTASIFIRAIEMLIIREGVDEHKERRGILTVDSSDAHMREIG